MNILQTFIDNSNQTLQVIGIGINGDSQGQRTIHDAIKKVITTTKSKIIVVGTQTAIDRYKKSGYIENDQVECISTPEPSRYLIESLFDFQNATSIQEETIRCDAIIRGGLSSAKFLQILRNTQKDYEKRENLCSPQNKNNSEKTYRLALLETAQGHQFFYGGVGIDEVNSFTDKKHMIEQAIQLFKALKLTPNIGILSGGRLGDIGRDPWIDQTIEEAEELTQQLQHNFPHYQVKHYQVMIEQAMQEKVNLLIAPEGIAGNLIYRTLVHLGNGRSYGALYLTHYNLFKKKIIDCSRVAPEFEIEGSLYFGLGLPTPNSL